MKAIGKVIGAVVVIVVSSIILLYAFMFITAWI